MFWRKITVLVGGPVLIMLLLAFGHQHNLFHTNDWYDLLLHYLGGLFLVFTLAGTLWHLDLIRRLDLATHPGLFKTGLIIMLTLTSIAWEFLEVYLDMTPNWTHSVFDTITDTLCALAGGLTALLFIRPARQPEKKLRVPSFENIPK